MNTFRFIFLVGLLSTGHAQEQPSVSEAFLHGKPSLDSRLRLESVADDAFVEDAQALTWRNRLGYRTAPWQGLTLFAELEDVRALDESYNSTANSRTRFPVVADPQGSEWNQAAIAWDSGPNENASATQLVLGRQRIVLDNQRYFGNSGWRQNEQTFDAFTAIQTIQTKTTFKYAYLDKVHRVFGQHHPNRLLARFNLDGHLINIAHSLGAGTLTGYGYWIENKDLPLSSTRSIGVRFSGATPLSDAYKLLYTIEFARQNDWRDGATTMGARCSLAELGLVHGPLTAKIAQEVLGGNGASAFQTPFATLHAFNGWDDKFLTTPLSGLVDRYVSLGGAAGTAQWLVAYHQFDADTRNAISLSKNYGSEWDASISVPFKQRFSAIAKFARYDANSFSSDNRKFWLSLEYRY